MLETVREYALERLEDADGVRDRHARAFARRLEGGRERMEGAELPAWLARLDTDHDNLRAAIRHATARGDAATALAIAGAMWRYWVMRGNVAEGRALAEAALALLVQNLGLVHAGLGHRERAVALHEGAWWPPPRRGSRAVQSLQRGLARLLIDEDPDRARAVLRETLGGSHAMADTHGIIHCLETARGAGRRPPARRAAVGRGGRAAGRRRRAPASRTKRRSPSASRLRCATPLGPDAFTDAVAEGAALPQADAVALALS